MKLHVKPAKYHNTPVEVDGIRFDSKAEAARYVQLKALRASGRILWLPGSRPSSCWETPGTGRISWCAILPG